MRYQLKPKEDITAFELATLLATATLACDERVFDQLPVDVQRHFEVAPDDPLAAMIQR